jgi:hypothetical protein
LLQVPCVSCKIVAVLFSFLILCSVLVCFGKQEQDVIFCFGLTDRFGYLIGVKHSLCLLLSFLLSKLGSHLLCLIYLLLQALLTMMHVVVKRC